MTIPEPGTERCVACNGIVSDADDSAVVVGGRLFHAGCAPQGRLW